MTIKKDNWEKPRTRGQHLTESDIASLKASYRAGKSSREAACAIKCSSRIASKYYGFFIAEGVPRSSSPMDISAASRSRFYRSNFEL